MTTQKVTKFSRSLIISSALLLASATCYAGGMNMPGKPGSDRGMRNASCGAMADLSEEAMDKRARSMQEHMLKMHGLADRILVTQDTDERERLKAQQLQLIKTHMAEKMQRKMKMKQNCAMMQKQK